jgi:hypothetical protein
MRISLDFNGYEFELSDSGTLESKDGKSGCSSSPGKVGLQIHRHGLSKGQVETICQCFLQPSQARALASVILATATEAAQRRVP